MGFWKGWWFNELLTPNNSSKYIPEVQVDWETLGKAAAYIKEHEEEWFQKGVQIGEEMRFQEGIQADYKAAVNNKLDVDGAKSLGFEGAEDLIKAIDEGRVEVYSEDGYNKFRWAK